MRSSCQKLGPRCWAPGLTVGWRASRWPRGAAHGKGQVIYLGTYLTPELAEQVFETICIPPGTAPLLPGRARGRRGFSCQARDRALWFILNTQATPVHVPHVPKGRDLLGGRLVGESGLDLGP